MSVEGRDSDSLLEWSAAAQGDIVELSRLGYWSEVEGGKVEYFDTPDGVVLVSQTCDLVQTATKDRVLVAPIVACSPAEISQIKKGQRPLRILVGSSLNRVADLERVTSVSRAALAGLKVLDRTSNEQSGKEAAQLAARIGRGFSRFAFPNEVHEALRKLQRKVSDGYSKQTKFATILGRVEEFRVACSDWNRPGRNLVVYVLVPSDFLPPADMKPDDWVWSTQNVTGSRSGMRPQDLDLEMLSDLILQNTVADNDSALVELWRWWGEALSKGWLGHSDDQVSSIELEVVSMAEFSYETYVETEALDFSTLSLASE